MRARIKNGMILMGLILGCSIGAATAYAFTPVPDGEVLYANNCAVCHGALDASAKIGANSTLINYAISGNIGGMGSLSSLAPDEIQAIATSLATVPRGASLYASNCVACHGGLSSTAKAGADSTTIQNAITANTGGMGTFATLTPVQVQAIASALTVAPAGTALYAGNCAACHGVITASAKFGADSSRIQNAIGGDTGGMGALSALTLDDIQAISAVLTSP